MSKAIYVDLKPYKSKNFETTYSSTQYSLASLTSYWTTAIACSTSGNKISFVMDNSKSNFFTAFKFNGEVFFGMLKVGDGTLTSMLYISTLSTVTQVYCIYRKADRVYFTLLASSSYLVVYNSASGAMKTYEMSSSSDKITIKAITSLAISGK